MAKKLSVKEQTKVDREAAAAEEQAPQHVVESANAEPERSDESKTEIALEMSHGVHHVVPAPEGFNFDRTLRINGANHEHVTEDDKGRWVYRRM